MPDEKNDSRERRMDTFGAAGEVDLEQRDGEAARIVGVAALYYDGTPRTEYEMWPGYVERIRPGAFAGLLKEGTDTMGLFNHDPSQILGRTTAKTLRLTSKRRGLLYEIDPPDTQTGRDVVENLRNGNITGSSFSFTIGKDKVTTDEDRDVMVREIIKVERLFDVGPVTYPAYENTEAGLRSVDTGPRGDVAPPGETDETETPEGDAQAAEDEARGHALAPLMERERLEQGK